MSRGRTYPIEVRARVLADILTGVSVSAAARAHGVDKATASRWAAADATVATVREREQDPEMLVVAIFDLCLAHIEALRSQLATVSTVDYVRDQPAAAVAELMTAEAATLLRVLAGFRPRDDVS